MWPLDADGCGCGAAAAVVVGLLLEALEVALEHGAIDLVEVVGDQVAGPRDASVDGLESHHVEYGGGVVEVARRYLGVERAKRLRRHDQRALEHVLKALLELLVDVGAEREVVHEYESMRTNAKYEDKVDT